MKLSILFATFAGAIALSGCAPGRFEKATTTYASSVANVQTATEEGFTKLATYEVTLRDYELMRHHAQPYFATTCDAGTIVIATDGGRLAGCGLVSVRSQPITLDPAWRTQPVEQKILSLYAGYAKSLQALTSADERKEIDAATNAAAAFLGGAVSLAATPAAGAAATAAVKLVGFAYAETVDAIRYNHLRQAVREGQKQIPVLDKPLRNVLTLLKIAHLQMNDSLGRRYAEAAVPRSPHYVENFAKASAYAVAVETIQRTDPVATLDAMEKAHGVLAEALEKNEGETVALFTAMNDFATRAAALRTSIETLSKGSGT